MPVCSGGKCLGCVLSAACALLVGLQLKLASYFNFPYYDYF